jgi:hypothetical protein
MKVEKLSRVRWYSPPYEPGKFANKRPKYTPEEKKRNEEQVKWLQRAVDAQTRRRG